MANPLRIQWTNPSDILSLLLLLGGDVIQRALAQQTGDHSWPTPVVFSFGWVAYAFLGLLSAVGDNKLLPAPDIPAVVFTTALGYVRNNQSWIIGRIIRDFEQSWMPTDVRNQLTKMLEKTRAERGTPKAPRVGLCITIFEAHPTAKAGVPHRDFYWKSGYVVAVVQLLIAAIPWIVWKQWETFVITAGGTVLAFTTGSLPQWRRERWACRENSRKTFVLTRGNGAQHALVIKGEGRGLDLEDLAGAGEGIATASLTRWSSAGLATLWVALLISVSGVKEHTWFLVAIGTIGMLHTCVIAGAARKPEAFGIHLEYKEVIMADKVMSALMQAEQAHAGLGRSMLSTFFPGDLKTDETTWWNAAKDKEEQEKDRKAATAAAARKSEL